MIPHPRPGGSGPRNRVGSRGNVDHYLFRGRHGGCRFRSVAPLIAKLIRGHGDNEQQNGVFHFTSASAGIPVTLPHRYSNVELFCIEIIVTLGPRKPSAGENHSRIQIQEYRRPARPNGAARNEAEGFAKRFGRKAGAV